MGRPRTDGLGEGTVALWTPVVGVAALTQSGLGLERSWTGSDLSLAVSGLLLAAPLVVRREHPLLTAALVAAALPIQVHLGGSLAFGTFVATLVASYALGRRAPVGTAAAGVVLLLAGVVLAMRADLPAHLDELAFPVFYLFGSAGLGAVARHLADQAAELERLNAALALERDASARLAVATERMRLARDLHDVVAHTLTVTVVQAEDCEEAVATDPDRAAAAAREIQQVGRRGLAELRSMVRVLRDSGAPETEPGLADLETLASVLAAAGLAVTVRRDGAGRAPADEVAGDLFRIVQEALTNVVKHSAARSAEVGITSTDRELRVTVTDPGPALATGFPSGTHGLVGMGERLAPYGGTVEAGPQGQGFRLQARVPLDRAAVS